MDTKKEKAAVWILLAALTGGGAGIYPQLATTSDLEALERRTNTRIEVFSGGVYDLFLENVNEKIIELDGIDAKTSEQNQTLARLLIRKEKLIRVLTQEASK